MGDTAASGPVGRGQSAGQAPVVENEVPGSNYARMGANYCHTCWTHHAFGDYQACAESLRKELVNARLTLHEIADTPIPDEKHHAKLAEVCRDMKSKAKSSLRFFMSAVNISPE